MKLYGYANSPNDRRVRAVAYHLGLDFEYVQIDLAKGEQHAPEFLAINPNGRIPTLVDGDFVLWETIAIMQYLASRTENTLWPADDRTRADIMRWQAWTFAHWGAAVGTMTFEKLAKQIIGEGAPDEAKIKEALEEFHTHSAVLNDHLKGREWIVGEALTLADLSPAAMLTYHQLLELPLADYPEIERWYASIETLDAWKRTVPPFLRGEAP